MLNEIFVVVTQRDCWVTVTSPGFSISVCVIPVISIPNGSRDVFNIYHLEEDVLVELEALGKTPSLNP